MNIELIDIGFLSFPIIIIFLLISFFTYLINVYIIFDGKLKPNVIFDIGFITILGGAIFARILGILNDIQYYLDLEWTLLPLSDTASGVSFVSSMPWQLFNIFDQNLILWGLPIGIILTSYFLYQNSNKKKDIFKFLDNIVFALMPAVVILSVGNYMSIGYIDSQNNIYQDLGSFYSENQFVNIALFEVIILFISAIILLIVRAKYKQEGIFTAGFLIIQSLLGFLVINQLAQINLFANFSWVLIMSFLIFFVSIFIIFHSNFKKLVTRNNRKPKKTYKKGEDLIRTKAISDIESEKNKKSIKRYFRWKK